MTAFPRIRKLIDQWTKPSPPPDVIPVKRTWGDWFTDLGLSLAKAGVVRFLKLLLYLFERK